MLLPIQGGGGGHSIEAQRLAQGARAGGGEYGAGVGGLNGGRYVGDIGSGQRGNQRRKSRGRNARCPRPE